jgi:hypothetical protein
VRVLGGCFVAFHLVLAPLTLPLRSYQIGIMQDSYDGAYGSLERLGDLEGRTLVIVQGPDWMWTAYAPHWRRLMGEAGPDRVWALGTGLAATRVSRPDERTLELASEEGFLTSIMDQGFRHRNRPFRPGDRATLGPVAIEVREVTADGRPARLVASFPVPLEASELVWAVWTSEGYVPFAVPEVGETATVEAISLAAMAGFRYEGDEAPSSPPGEGPPEGS